MPTTPNKDWRHSGLRPSPHSWCYVRTVCYNSPAGLSRFPWKGAAIATLTVGRTEPSVPASLLSNSRKANCIVTAYTSMPRLIVSREAHGASWFCRREDNPGRSYGAPGATAAFENACRAFGFVAADYHVIERSENRVVYEWRGNIDIY